MLHAHEACSADLECGGTRAVCVTDDAREPEGFRDSLTTHATCLQADQTSRHIIYTTRYSTETWQPAGGARALAPGSRPALRTIDRPFASANEPE